MIDFLGLEDRNHHVVGSDLYKRASGQPDEPDIIDGHGHGVDNGLRMEDQDCSIINLILTAADNGVGTSGTNSGGNITKRVASYVWGPDIGSKPFGRSSWQEAGGVGGLLAIVDGVNSGFNYPDVDYNGAASGNGTAPADPVDDDYLPLMDPLGNVTGLHQLTYGNLTLQGTLDYDAFGREIRSTGPACDKVPFHFSTKFTDPETGLNYYGYRFYDSNNGRWINRDPIGEYGGVNLFGMISNSIIDDYDLLGLCKRPNMRRQGHHYIPYDLFKECDENGPVCELLNSLENLLRDDDYSSHNGKELNGVTGPAYNKLVEKFLALALKGKKLCDCEPKELKELLRSVKTIKSTDAEFGKVRVYLEGVKNEIKSDRRSVRLGRLRKIGGGVALLALVTDHGKNADALSEEFLDRAIDLAGSKPGDHGYDLSVPAFGGALEGIGLGHISGQAIAALIAP